MALEADGEVIRIAHNDHVASGQVPSPSRGLVQVELARRCGPGMAAEDMVRYAAEFGATPVARATIGARRRRALHTRLRVRRHPAFPTPSFGRKIHAQPGRIAPRECECAFAWLSEIRIRRCSSAV